MYYHHESLLQYEASQRYDERSDALLAASYRPSYTVITPDWQQDADNDEELNNSLMTLSFAASMILKSP